MPEFTGNLWEDAKIELDLIRALNEEGNKEAEKRFAIMLKDVYNNLNDKEKNLLKLVDFKANPYWMFWNDKPDSITAMDILRDYFLRWFSSKANKYAKYNPHIYWVPWSFLMNTKYIKDKNDELVANLFNEAAKKSLYEQLQIAGMIGNDSRDFDFTTGDPLLWKKSAYQERVLNYQGLSRHPYFKPQSAAMGSFTINALPKGRVISLKGGGHRICVDSVYTFAHDTFNFEGSARLGFWNLNNKKFPSFGFNMCMPTNKDFRDFREKHGYGGNFTVLSPLQKVQNFDGICWDVK